MTGKQVIQLLKEGGWVEVRQNGSHKILKHPLKKNNISVPIHSAKDLKKGLLNRIIKDAELILK